jgi:hypothetical protein
MKPITCRERGEVRGRDLHGGLPGPDALDPLWEGPLVQVAQLEGVAPDLYEVVEEGTAAGQGVGRAEQGDIAELDEHLEKVVEGPLVARRAALHLYLGDGPPPGLGLARVPVSLLPVRRHLHLKDLPTLRSTTSTFLTPFPISYSVVSMPPM